MSSTYVATRPVRKPEHRGRPHELTTRATADFQQLLLRFGDPISPVAHMIVSGSWVYLKRPDGRPYRSMPAVVAAASGLSGAQSRRIVQAAIELYIPLMDAFTNGDWRMQGVPLIPPFRLTPTDVRQLGAEGAHEVVKRVNARLPAAREPTRFARLLRTIIDEVRSEQQAAAGPPSCGGGSGKASPSAIGAETTSERHLLASPRRPVFN